MAISTVDLAADLGVDEGDVRALLEELAEHEHELAEVEPGALPDEWASFVRRVLDPHGERTAPAGFYWPGQVPLPQEHGVLGADPTAPEGDYPPLV